MTRPGHSRRFRSRAWQLTRTGSGLVLAAIAPFAAHAQAAGQPVTPNEQGAPPSASSTETTPAPAPADNPATAAPVASGAVRQDLSGGDIVVTGSRLIRNGNAAPTPVTVATAEKLFQQTPSNVADGLNKLPALFGSQSQTTQLGANNTRAGNYLNLRAFGFNRVLVLYDTHRVVPTSIDNTVDINTIPQLLLQRVDIVTAGASAVYGSDAVSGVVNFIPDTKFVGYKGVAQGGISGRGDDGSQRVGLAGGWKIGERGHLELSAEYYNSDGIKAKEFRPLGKRAVSETGAGTAANPYVLSENVRIAAESYGGLIATGPLQGQMFTPGGGLATFNPGTATRSAGLSSGGDGAYYRNTSLVAGLENKLTYGRFDYALTDSINVYVRGTYSDARNSQVGLQYADPRLPGSNTGIVIYSGNAFLPAAVQSTLTSTNTASFQLGRLSEDLAPRPVYDRTRSYGGAVGANGKILGKFNWDVFYEHARSTLDITTTNNISNPRFYAAVDAVRDPGGNIVCRVTLTNPGLYPGCVPLNLFGEASPSQAAAAYIANDTSTHTVNKLDDVSLNVNGDLFDLWAGPLSVAIGGEYRKAVQITTSSVDFTTVPSYAGLRGGFNAASTLPYTGPALGVGGGSNRVWEVSGETELPLFKDSVLGKSLDLNGAVRYTNYQHGGTVVTWKGGISYEPFADLRIRAVVSRDIRAPSLNELFAGRSVSQLGYNDTHTNRSSSVQLQTSGNPDLVPERALTVSGGVVYRPHWFPGFSASVDYFQIDLKDAIAQVGGNNAISAATCEQSNGTSPLCQLFIRPLPFADRTPANYPTLLIAEYLNVGTAFTRGVDFEADYQTAPDALVPGIVGLRLLGTFQPISKTLTFPGSPVQNNAGTAANNSLGLPKLRVSLAIDYALGNVSLNFTGRYRSKLLPSPNTALVFIDSQIPSQFVADASITYKVPNSRFETFIAVNNLFDQKPAPYGNLSNTASPGAAQAQGPGEDVVLRYFTIGTRFRF